VESNHILEKVESLIPLGIIREISNLRRPWPRDNRHKSNTSNNGALNPINQSATATTAEGRQHPPIHHQQSGDDPTTKDTNPKRRIPHLSPFTNPSDLIPKLRLASGQIQGSGHSAGDCADTSGVRQSDKRKVKPNTSSGSEFDGSRDSPGEPLPQSQYR